MKRLQFPVLIEHLDYTLLHKSPVSVWKRGGNIIRTRDRGWKQQTMFSGCNREGYLLTHKSWDSKYKTCINQAKKKIPVKMGVDRKSQHYLRNYWQWWLLGQWESCWFSRVWPPRGWPCMSPIHILASLTEFREDLFFQSTWNWG